MRVVSRLRSLGVVVCSLSVILLAGGCGGPSKSSGPTSVTLTEDQEAAIRYAAALAAAQQTSAERGQHDPTTSPTPAPTSSATASTSSAGSPPLVPGNVTSVATSSEADRGLHNFVHSCAIVGGAAKCWGSNRYGRLGDGTTRIESNMPVQVVGLDSGVTAISVGTGHSCAVVSGAAKCWGDNYEGELGIGQKYGWSNTPVQVLGLEQGVSAISAGFASTCAVVFGAARCWGFNGDFQLGDGTDLAQYSPVAVFGLDAGVTGISVGYSSVCAVVDGAAKCWGSNRYGQLGDGTTRTRATPVDVVGLSDGVTTLSIGGEQNAHACAVAIGAGWCWGDYGIGPGSSVPVSVSVSSGVATDIEVGAQGGCIVVDSGVLCWGYNLGGVLGDGSNVSGVDAPVAVSGLQTGVSGISVGYATACAVVVDMAMCWGDNFEGQLGDGTNTSTNTPRSVLGL